MIILLQGVSPVYAAESNKQDVLYPSHMLPKASFQGGFTTDMLEYLEKLPSAEALRILNVLRGSGGDLMLDRTANRMEGATMLVRLLGAEEEALAENYSHPFTDVASWASPYIGYLYQKGLTNGVGNNLYGSELAMNEKAYLTFLLRSLGYSDKEGLDFTWNTVDQAAAMTGLLGSDEKLDEQSPFKRSRLSELSWRAMFLNHKIQDQYLIVFLFNEGMISEQNLEVLLESENPPLLDQWFSYLPQVKEAFRSHQEKIEFLLDNTLANNDKQKYLSILLERVQNDTGIFFMGYATELWQEGDEYKLYLSPRYANTLQEDKQLFAWIDDIIATIIQPEMTDYEKVKAAHDFLIIALQYDTRSSIPDSSYHAFGALNTAKAVCSGYAELMVLMLNKAGVPCRMVTGTGDGIEHAWNIVYINGETYHVDTTWDDPVTGTDEITLRYDYFNLTDEEMRKEHIWVTEDYPACTATSENYYIKEKLMVTSADGLKNGVGDAVKNRKTRCVFKLQGFNITDDKISEMMNEINEKAGYVMNTYRYTFNESMRVIMIESIEYIK